MTIAASINPFELFTDASGRPLDSGFIYIGETNKDPRNYPVPVFYDAQKTIPAPMPMRTQNGYVYRNGSPALLFLDGNYSILVLDKTGSQVFYVPDYLMIGNGSAISAGALANTVDPTMGISLIPTASRLVPNIVALRQMPKTGGSKQVFVQGYNAIGDGGGGDYYLDTTDTTSADNAGTIIVATDGGRWKLIHNGVVGIEQFGAVGTGLHDVAMAAALAWAQAANATTEFANAKLTFGAGKTLNLAGSYPITTPIQMTILSKIADTGTSGNLFTIGATYSDRNTGWDIQIPQGSRCVNGNTALPTAVSAAGRSFMEVRRMQFGNLQLGTIIAYPRFGLYLNGSEDAFTNQHIQDNTIRMGQTAYCGVGLKLLSNSAQTGGVQVNEFWIDNLFANFHNLDIDDDTHSNSTDNIFHFKAMDKHASGGYGVNCFGSFNQFYFGFAETSLLFQASAYYNIIRTGNNQSNGVAISDVNNTNWFVTSPPDLSQLPAVQPLALGVTFKNQFGVPVTAMFTVSITTTNIGPTGLSVKTGRNAATLTEKVFPQVGGTASAMTFNMPVTVILKHGDMMTLTKTGAGTVTVSNICYDQSSC